MVDSRHVRRRLTAQSRLKVDRLEERLTLDFVGAIASQTGLRLAAQSQNEALGVGGEPGLRGDDQLVAPVDDALLYGGLAVRVEGRVTDDHLVEDDAY